MDTTAVPVQKFQLAVPRAGLESELKADELRLTPSYVSAAKVAPPPVT